MVFSLTWQKLDLQRTAQLFCKATKQPQETRHWRTHELIHWVWTQHTFQWFWIFLCLVVATRDGARHLRCHSARGCVWSIGAVMTFDTLNYPLMVAGFQFILRIMPYRNCRRLQSRPHSTRVQIKNYLIVFDESGRLNSYHGLRSFDYPVFFSFFSILVKKRNHFFIIHQLPLVF